MVVLNKMCALHLLFLKLIYSLISKGNTSDMFLLIIKLPSKASRGNSKCKWRVQENGKGACMWSPIHFLSRMLCPIHFKLCSSFFFLLVDKSMYKIIKNLVHLRAPKTGA